MPSLTPDDWAQIRYAYQHTTRPVEDICAAHGISSGTLRDRMRRWGWTRRRTPIPSEGPPALVVPLIELKPIAPHTHVAPHPDPLPAFDSKTGVNVLSREREENDVAAHAHVAPHTHVAPHPDPLPEADIIPANTATIVSGLQSAVARLLPAIAAITARLAAGPHAPRDIEQMGRALGTLTRTLRELNALLNEQRDAAPADPGDPMPDDIDEFRRELARRIEAFVASQDAGAAIPAAQGDADDAPC